MALQEVLAVMSSKQVVNVKDWVGGQVPEILFRCFVDWEGGCVIQSSYVV